MIFESIYKTVIGILNLSSKRMGEYREEICSEAHS